MEAARVLPHLGIDSPEMYETIALRLKKDGFNNELDSDYEDLLEFFCFGLAASGNMKYFELFKKLETEGGFDDIRDCGEDAPVLLARYKEWKGIINQSADPKLEIERKHHFRYINMIESEDPRLVIIAAQRIIKERISDRAVLDSVEKLLLSQSKKAVNKYWLKAMVLLIKGISRAGDNKYVPALLHISRFAEHPKVRIHAKDHKENILEVSSFESQ